MQRRNLIKVLLAGTVSLAALPSTVLAKLGRPASPTSVAGVRRRTRRRTRRRIWRGMRLSYLPYGCTVTRRRSGVTFYYCGGIWYRPAYQGTTVIYIVEEIEAGAETDVEFEEDVYE
jgi:hypothetical protein